MEENEMTPGVTSGVQSIDRALWILETLSGYSRGLHLSDLSKRLNLHASTMHRLLNTLAVHGYVQKDVITGKYKLTMRLYELGSRALGDADLGVLAKPHLDYLADLTGEVIHLAALQGDSILYLYKADAAIASVRLTSTVGRSNPLYCTGVGKAILSCWTEQQVADYWGRTQFQQFTPYTITELSVMQKELEESRRCRYAMDNEEHELGIRCIAAPVMDFQNRPVAAISISTLAARMGDREIARYAPLIQTTAREISQLLGQSSGQ